MLPLLKCETQLFTAQLTVVAMGFYKHFFYIYTPCKRIKFELTCINDGITINACFLLFYCRTGWTGGGYTDLVDWYWMLDRSYNYAVAGYVADQLRATNTSSSEYLADTISDCIRAHSCKMAHSYVLTKYIIHRDNRS